MTGQPTPPHDLRAEESLLGALILDRDAIAAVAERVAPADFYRQAHGRIFAAIAALYERREPPDATTLAAELERRGQLEEVGGVPALAGLVLAVPTAVHAPHYAALVAKHAALRRLIAAGTALVNEGYRQGADPAAVLARVQEALQAASSTGAGRDFVTLAEALGGALVRLDTLSTPGARQQGVPSGFADLDRLTGGWQPATLVVLAARPSVGKSAVALAMARAAARAGHAVAFFSLEMDVPSLVLRLLSAESAVPLIRLRDATLTPHEWFRAAHSTAGLAGLPVYLDDTASLTVERIRAKVARLRQHAPVGLIVVDYLQLITPPRGEGQNRVGEVDAIARGLKLLARESGLPVLALAQVNRAAEARGGGGIPQLRDLRESGGIEANGDMVIFLHRDELFDPASARRGLTEVHISKHRNGPLGVVALRSDLAIGRYSDTALAAV